MEPKEEQKSSKLGLVSKERRGVAAKTEPVRAELRDLQRKFGAILARVEAILGEKSSKS